MFKMLKCLRKHSVLLGQLSPFQLLSFSNNCSKSTSFHLQVAQRVTYAISEHLSWMLHNNHAFQA